MEAGDTCQFGAIIGDGSQFVDGKVLKHTALDLYKNDGILILFRQFLVKLP